MNEINRFGDNMKQYSTIFMSALIVLFIAGAGCKSKKSDSDATETKQEQVSAQEKPGTLSAKVDKVDNSRVLAKVNGRPITENQLAERISPDIERQKNLGIPENLQETFEKELRKNTLEKMIAETLFDQKAAELVEWLRV
jgi:hypothetical protein